MKTVKVVAAIILNHNQIRNTCAARTYGGKMADSRDNRQRVLAAGGSEGDRDNQEIQKQSTIISITYYRRENTL